MADKLPPIIVKKIKKGGHGHHGGAWKVAYADFVTAMMAFFLLMWLLNATTEEQKMGLADYFSPSLSTTRTGGGGEGLLGGTSAGSTGVQVSPGSPLLPAIETQPKAPEEVTDDKGDSAYKSKGVDGQVDADKSDANNAEFVAQQEKVKKEEDQFDSVASALKAAIDNIPALQELSDNLKIELTDEGLKIQLIDQQNYSMFPSGEAKMNNKTEELMKMVVTVMKSLPNKISITGHTDAHPFTSREGYDNWDLSSDRANAVRRFVVANGIDRQRVEKVEGKADIDPYVKDDPFAPQNRRVSVTILRENKAIPK